MGRLRKQRVGLNRVLPRYGDSTPELSCPNALQRGAKKGRRPRSHSDDAKTPPELGGAAEGKGNEQVWGARVASVVVPETRLVESCTVSWPTARDSETRGGEDGHDPERSACADGTAFGVTPGEPTIELLPRLGFERPSERWLSE
jgi:hypothetical protein